MRSWPGGHDEVQGLGLGHRQLEQVELGGVGRHQAMHQAVEGADDAIEIGVGVARPARAWGGSWQVLRYLRTIGCSPTISEDRGMCSGYHRPVPPRTIDRATARRFLVRRHLLAPPRALAAGARLGARRRGPPRVAPVRPARRHRAQPRPRPGRPHRRLPAGLDRRRCCTASAGCTSPTTRACPCCRRPSCRGTGSAGIGSRAGHGAETFAAHADLVTELLERITARRPAVVDRRRATRGDRLVLAPDQPGPGRPRGARPGRHPRPRPTRRQHPRSTTSPSGSSRRTCWPSAATEDEQRQPQAAVAVPGARPARRARRPGRDLAGDRAERRGAHRRPRDALLDAGALTPVDGRGRAWRAAGPDRRAAAPGRGRGESSRPASRTPAGSPSWRRSIRSPGIATCCARCSTSTTSGRSTSRPPSAAGATTSCRCCGATGWSAGSSRASSARPARWPSSTLWWEDGLRPAGRSGLRRGLRRCAHRPCAVPGRRRAWPGRGSPAIGRSGRAVAARLGPRWGIPPRS